MEVPLPNFFRKPFLTQFFRAASSNIVTGHMLRKPSVKEYRFGKYANAFFMVFDWNSM